MRKIPEVGIAITQAMKAVSMKNGFIVSQMVLMELCVEIDKIQNSGLEVIR